MAADPNRGRLPKSGPGSRKFGMVMREFDEGRLHHGGTGEVVTSPKVARAIAASEARRVASGKRKR